MSDCKHCDGRGWVYKKRGREVFGDDSLCDDCESTGHTPGTPAIYDDPNHAQYGPVRRMWIILVQLDLLEAANARVFYFDNDDGTWDHVLARNIRERPENSESFHQKSILELLI